MLKFFCVVFCGKNCLTDVTIKIGSRWKTKKKNSQESSTSIRAGSIRSHTETVLRCFEDSFGDDVPNDLKPFIIYSLGMMVEYLSEEDEEFYRGVLEDAVNDYYNNDFRIEEALSKPLFRTPIHFVKTYKEEVYEIIV